MSEKRRMIRFVVKLLVKPAFFSSFKSLISYISPERRAVLRTCSFLGMFIILPSFIEKEIEQDQITYFMML